MELNFFKSNNLEQQLERLSSVGQIAFAASCCERLFPFYKTFSETDNWGDSSVPRKALDTIWQVLAGAVIDRVEIQHLIEDCCREGICPTDDDNFGHSSLFIEAGNCIYAICTTLEACLEPNVKSIVTVNQHLKEAIEYYVMSFDTSFQDNCATSRIDEEIAAFQFHPLAIREMEKQSEDIQCLQESQVLTLRFLKELQNSSITEGEFIAKFLFN